MIEESLLQAIKKDDAKAFNALMETARCGEYRLGRFPVLSLLYLYKSRRILSEHENLFLKISSFEALREPVEISKKFSAKAGKCLRLYFCEVVSPVEMLLILDKTKRLKRIYPLTKPSLGVKGRLKSIYSIKYSLNVGFDGDNIIIDKRPLSYREKKNIATACMCSALAVIIAVGVPVTTVSLMPKPVEGEVTRLKDIDFNSQKEYILKSDIVLPENYSVEKVNCKIIGEGNKLVFGKGATLGELNGKMSDLTIESAGDVIFTSVSQNATVENVIINVSADIRATASAALVAATNYGTFDGVTVNVSGKINALAAAESTAELTFGGIVLNNAYRRNVAGTIKNCTVNYSQFELVGEVSANASFGGVAGINNGYLQSCTVTGEIQADTFDIAGVCSVNNGLLSGNSNNANLSQTSSETDWNPITCGIVLSNTYAVEDCENSGKISAVSDSAQSNVQEGYESTVSAAGIAYLNRSSTSAPYLKNCTNFGDVECTAEFKDVYAAGICLSSSGEIDSCKNSGAVTVKANNGGGTYVGGITALAYDNISKSVNEGAVSASGSGTAYVGGISAYICALLQNCFSNGDVAVTAKTIYVGGIFGFSDAFIYYWFYYGIADKCISESKITVSALEDIPAFVGGIAGYVSEEKFNSGVSVIYYGGCVTNCYFIGSYASDISYFGNIVGAVGANIYESNSYTSGNTVYHNFEGNYYLNNSLTAFGTTVTESGGFASAEDKECATTATIEDIQNSEAYQSILNTLKNN